MNFQLYDSDSDSDLLGLAPGTLSIFALAKVLDDGTGEFLETGGSGSATWVSDTAGSVAFENYHWDLNAPSFVYNAAWLNGHPGGVDWSYTFIAGPNEMFTLNYNMTFGGDAFGLCCWEFFIDGSSIGPFEQVRGTYSFALVNGQQYTVSLSNNSNLSTIGALDDYTSRMDGQFDWSISAVPEPSSMIILATGLTLLAGTKLRRNLRRRP